MGHDIQKLGRIDGAAVRLYAFMNAILSQVLEDVPSRDFRVPLGITGPVSICSKSGLRPGPHCPEEDIVEEIFLLEKPRQDAICISNWKFAPEAGSWQVIIARPGKG